MHGQANPGDVLIPLDIMLKAKERSMARSKEGLRDFCLSLEQPQMHSVLDCLPCVVGLPRNVFLNRLASIGECVSKCRKVATVSIIETNIDAISDFIDEGAAASISKRVETVKRVEALRQLCELANTPRRLKDFDEWVKHHTTQLHNALIFCLNAENPVIVEEASLTIAFLARKLHFSLLKAAETLITAMVTAIAVAMAPTESHVEQMRKALDFHAEMEISKGRTLDFHFPRLNYEFVEPKFRPIGYVYYAIADFLYNVPHPFLIHYFQCRILRRKEMTRKHLFKILFALIENMGELEEFAKKHCPRVEKPKPQIVEKPPPNTGIFKPTTPSSGFPKQSSVRQGATDEAEGESETWIYKPEVYRREQWETLPSKLYVEMLRAYHDRNAENRNIIANIMAVLRSIAHVKLPALDLTSGSKLEYLRDDSIDRFSKRIRIATPKLAGSESGEAEMEAEGEEDTIQEALKKDNRDTTMLKVVLPGEGEGVASALLEQSKEPEDRSDKDDYEDEGAGAGTADSQSESASYQSDPETMRAINRPTVLLARPPKLSKLKL
ncbi:unnamed protein product [Hydatigera taeniaeformis]|uniref:Uncharacterized protein n=1 Tax=Hydatigena taeniaeformis TaxID=6205 RepID=A0A0R3X1V4_HYDTA|nr:unnamed protein product [Hydatigera taeniaeformis]